MATFEEAWAAVKSGKQARRANWKPVVPSMVIKRKPSGKPFLMLDKRNINGKGEDTGQDFIKWHPTLDDMLAEDWEIK